MNKKVLTLCAAMLLTGSLTTVNAASVAWKYFDEQKSEVTTATEGQLTVMKLTGDVELKNQKDYLLIDQNNFVFDGQGHTFKGHIVITGSNVTIKNLKLDYKNVFTKEENGTISVNKTAITVISDKVTIIENDITCSSDYWVANAITVFPTKEDATITISDNTISGCNSIVYKGDESQETGSTGIQVVEEYNLANTGLEGQLGSSESLKNFDAVASIGNNTFKDAYTDFSYVDWTTSSGDTKAIQVSVLKGTDGKIENTKAIKSLVTDATDKGDISKFNGTLYELEVALNAAYGENGMPNVATIECNDGVKEIQKGEIIVAGIQPASWGQYEYFKPATDALKNGSETLLVLRGAVVTTTHKEGVSSYYLNQYKPSDLEKDDIKKYTFTFDVVETRPNAAWEVRLKDGYGKYFTYKKQFVTVDVKVKKDAKKGFLFDGKEYLPIEFGLKAGNQYLAFDWATADWKTVSNIVDAQAFGTSTVGRAFMYAETLLKRYGEYFKLAITYDKDGKNETDLTSIFAGELTPVKNVWYDNGKISYDLADPKAREFMLINEKNQILVVNTDPKTAWSTGSQIHAFKLELIDARTYVLDLKKDQNYKATFSLEYKPSAAGMEGSTDIVAIYVDGREIGCYLDKQVPVLAATGNVGELIDVDITLNPSALVKAESWLTAPVYYNVTVKNQNKKAKHYGEVLGLSEEGSADFVDPENIDQTMPEGQFAIEWDGSHYVFTNREKKDAKTYILGSDFYEVDKSKNLFAYRDYQYNLMDTLEIAPISTYTDADGFKRFTTADLNNNTYTVSMKLLNGDSLNIVENHNDKHRVGLDEDKATEWRIEMSQVRLVDATNDFLRYVPDTVTVEVPIKYYVAGKGWMTTTTDAEKAENNKAEYVYNANAALKICTYILKNTDNNEYLRGDKYQESKGNQYYVCDRSTEDAIRIAFKKIGDETLNLVPAYTEYGSDWWDIRTVQEDNYKYYAENLGLSYNKIIGGTTSLTGVLKDEQYLYKAPTNDLFVINVAEAPTYKKMDQGSKIIISRLANNDEVIYEAGEFAGISNRAAYKDIKPTLYVDTAYVNRAGNFAYQYLLGVNIDRVDTTYQCNVPAHGIHKEDTTYGRFLVNMVDSAKACKDVHNNKFVYDGEYKLAFVEGYRTNDTLFFTNEADKVVSSMKIGDANSNIAKFAFKMIDEEANEFVIETGTGYINKEVVNGNGTVEVISEATVPGYLRWVNGNLVVTTNIEKAERFTMEASDKEATANENIVAGNVVVAGVNGAVVVKGAEGKNVIVSTILGKVVANEVVSSDNATIAAPAGIVVVSVDGESFKVVVK